jgi:quinol monooxygenase YgiN
MISQRGAFIQLIEYQTAHPQRMAELVAQWVEAIGAARTARWYVTASDRDQPGHFVQLVEFASYESAMANSEHPATADFAAGLRAACGDDLVFRNLDVVAFEQL